MLRLREFFNSGEIVKRTFRDKALLRCLMFKKINQILIIHRGSRVRPSTHSFIVRIWHEAVDNEGNILTWRGSVEHVGSDRRLYFSGLDEFTKFIREESELPDSRSTWWGRILRPWIRS